MSYTRSLAAHGVMWPRVALAALAYTALARGTADGQRTPRIEPVSPTPASAPFVKLVELTATVDTQPGSISADFRVFWSVRSGPAAITSEEARVELRLADGTTRVITRRDNLVPPAGQRVPPGANRSAFLSTAGPFPGSSASFRVSVRACSDSCVEQDQLGTLVIPRAAQLQGQVRQTASNPIGEPAPVPATSRDPIDEPAPVPATSRDPSPAQEPAAATPRP